MGTDCLSNTTIHQPLFWRVSRLHIGTYYTYYIVWLGPTTFEKHDFSSPESSDCPSFCPISSIWSPVQSMYMSVCDSPSLLEGLPGHFRNKLLCIKYLSWRLDVRCEYWHIIAAWGVRTVSLLTIIQTRERGCWRCPSWRCRSGVSQLHLLVWWWRGCEADHWWRGRSDSHSHTCLGDRRLPTGWARNIKAEHCWPSASRCSCPQLSQWRACSGCAEH